MSRDYNIHGDQRGITGTVRAVTAQVTPWEGDGDEAGRIRSHFGRKDASTDASSSGTKDDGDVWNRDDLQPTYEVEVGEDSLAGGEDEPRAFARDTVGDDGLRPSGPGDIAEDNDRAFARDTTGSADVRPETPKLDEESRERAFARDTGRLNDGLGDRGR